MSEKQQKSTRKYIGNLIREHRRIKKNISIDTLAERINVDTNNLSRIERGEQLPELLTFIKLIIVLDIIQNEYLQDMFALIQKEDEEKYK